MTKTENVSIGRYRRVRWELDDHELLLCRTFPWGNPIDVWVRELTLEEYTVAYTTLSLDGGSEMSESFIPFGSVVVLGETAL